MKVNKITFSKLYAQYELLKMRAAYILAEQSIIESASRGIDLTGYESSNYTIAFEDMGPEQFFSTSTGSVDEAESLLSKAREVRKKLDDAIQNDDYIKAQTFQNILNGLEIKYNKLKGNG